jgi:hypothetical protein
MESPPKSVKYHVQVVRLRFDAAIIEVQASDDSDAERKAIEQAQRLSDADWQLQPFDHAAYRPHAEAMIAEDELTGPEEVEDALAWSETRYLLLKGDCGAGEGDIVLQPWLKTEEPDLLASDLCSDWIGTLEELGLTHLSERLDGLARREPTHTVRPDPIRGPFSEAAGPKRSELRRRVMLTAPHFARGPTSGGGDTLVYWPIAMGQIRSLPL